VGLRPWAPSRRGLLVHPAEAAVANSPDRSRLTTLRAIRDRAGRFEEAFRQLSRSVEVHGADGTPYDALFLAMAHHQLGHAEESRRWLQLGTAADPIAVR